MACPPVGYLADLRELCDRHRVLLVADEVITGMSPIDPAVVGVLVGRRSSVPP